MASQIRTFQFRLPRGPHEADIAAVADHLSRVERRLHARLGRLLTEASEKNWTPRQLGDARNALKRETLISEGISGRQYNGVLRLLEGKHDAIRSQAKTRFGNAKRARKRVEGALAADEKKLHRHEEARAKLAVRAAAGKAPTRALLGKILEGEVVAGLRGKIHQRKRRLYNLDRKIEAAEKTASKSRMPSLVFGSAKLLRRRAGIHPNDHQAIAAWRRHWDLARSAQFFCIGSADELAGCKECRAGIVASGKRIISLSVKTPPALVSAGLPSRIEIGGITLPAFGASEVIEALEANARVPAKVTQRASGDRRVALSWRFVRTPGWCEKETLSAWQVFVTLKQEIEETSFEEASHRGALGVDINADHLAAALVDGKGNPIRRWRIDLPTWGKSSGQRDAIIGDVVAEITGIAARHRVPIVLEDLDFAEKKRALGDKASASKSKRDRRYARMLSSLAYARISTSTERRAERLGIAVRRVNPAWTSLIGAVNFRRRYGMSIHQAAATAIARRGLRGGLGCSERINYVYGQRGRRNTLPTRSESRRHVWRHWSLLAKDEARLAAVRLSSPASSGALPPGARKTRAGSRSGCRSRIGEASTGRSDARPAVARGAGLSRVAQNLRRFDQVESSGSK